MKTELLKQFQTTLNMPEVSRLNVGYDSSVDASILDLKLHGYEIGNWDNKVLLEEYLPIINHLLDNSQVLKSYIWLRGPRNQSFYLLLGYQSKGLYNKNNPEKFTARLSRRHSINYPEHIKNYSEWQIKLKELLAKLKL